jgi:hypothetical protein
MIICVSSVDNNNNGLGTLVAGCRNGAHVPESYFVFKRLGIAKIGCQQIIIGIRD